MLKAYYQSPLGVLIIKNDDDHINAISFSEGDYEPTPYDQLSFLQQKCIQQLGEYFAGERKAFDFPILQKGTPFQIKVWQHLSTIPYGKTISYMDLAKKLGDIKVIRAAGSANGKNNLAIVCPCHRVIGSNAKLVGYGGGLWRKNWLLQHEAKHHSGVQQFAF
ncbi:MAG TPA: methylated-DNA--[protein]-cysteine S-methyltransferase [Chitinophagaceae bacterium]|nr:methylated-DNA--[protein]-cysteine S-methyltransferase [Chitinophagaceae bacterium]